MIEEFRFALDFNSPAFLSAMPKGKKRIEHLRQTESEMADYYPADPRGIRIPSLRGVLEFWHRALQGDADSSQEIFDRQTSVFGSAERGQGVKIRPVGMPKFERRELQFGGRDEDPNPFLYLGYGPLQRLILSERPGDTHGRAYATSYHARGARDAILPDDRQRGRFRFVARGTREQIEALKRALTLLHLFGGLGSRSRRGWGSVEVTADGIQPPKGDIVPAEWFAATLAGVWTASQYPAAKGDPEFSALSRGTRIRVTKPIRGDYREVLVEFYKRFQAIRSYQSKRPLAVADHTLEWEDHSKRDPDQAITGVPKRLAFGMPFQPGHGNRWSIEYRGRVQGAEDEREISRRASPLILKVVRLGPQSHIGVALFLRSQFFGDPRFEIGAVGKDLTQPFPGYEAVDQFLDHSEWTEVQLP